MRDGRTVITLGCARSFFWFVAGITFFNYRHYIVNKSQTVDCLPTMFLRVRSVTQTNMLVGIKRLRFIWYGDLFCRSGWLSLLWKPMWKTATSGKLTNDAALTNIYEKYVCKKYYSYYFCTSILGDPGVASWVRKNGVESFQEWARVPLGCYSRRTSFTTYSNNCLWFGTKNNLVPNKKPVSIPLLSRFSYTRKVNRKLDCSPYMFDSCRRAFFSKNGTHKAKEIL